MYKVILMGASLTTGNMGVSALAASLVKLILTPRPDADVAFFITERSSKPQELELAGRKISIKIVNMRLSPQALLSGEHVFVLLLLALLHQLIPIRFFREAVLKSNERLRIISQADFIGDVRGGDSFSDIYGIKNFILGSLPSIITLFMGQKLILLPQTYGPYQSNISHRIARYILSHAHIILSRDRESMALAQNILGKKSSSKQIIFCPDVAFALDSIVPKDGVIKPFINTGKDNPIVGLNINGLLYNGGYTRDNMFNLKMDYKLFVHQLSETILKKTDANLLLIPHTFAARGHVESDPDACAEVFAALSPVYPERIQMLTGEYDQHAVKGVIGRCNFFIGSRMHSCIAALSQKIPTVAVAYSKKFKGVFASIDAGNFVIDARETEVREAVNMIEALLKDRAQIEHKLQTQVETVQQQQMKIFREITDVPSRVMDR